MSYFKKTINGQIINPITGYPIDNLLVTKGGTVYPKARTYDYNPTLSINKDALNELQEYAILKYWQ